MNRTVAPGTLLGSLTVLASPTPGSEGSVGVDRSTTAVAGGVSVRVGPRGLV